MPASSPHSRFDSHIHTPLCGHAVGDPTDYVEMAAARGLSLITFTCHIPMRRAEFAQAGIRMRHDDLPRYRDEIAQAAAYGRTLGVEVLCGIEAEIHPDAAAMEEMEETLASQSFDFVLGSLHHQLPAFRQYLVRQGAESDADKIRLYFRCLAEGARSGRYHSLAHPDVIRIYGSLKARFDPLAHRPVITEALDMIAESGTCLEINTSGLIKGDFVVHPDPVIMEWALERQIPFTIGSDSHHPDMLGQKFGPVLAQAWDLGLRQLHYFKGGQRIAADIPDALVRAFRD